LWGFAAAVAGAILTKSVAGILPLAVLGLYWLTAPPKYKPRFFRVCLAGLLAAALAAPWFLYQLAVHGRWFMAEHIHVEILGYGTGAPPQTSQENQAIFYALRMALMDPVLLAVALVALPGFFVALRKRAPAATLLLCWIIPALASVSVWHYRNASYLLPLIPALAILATCYGPFATMRPSWWMLALTAAAVVLKMGAPHSPAGISFAAGTIQPVAPLVSNYCDARRGNEFILVDLDDDLYASTLPLPRLRYASVQPNIPTGQYGMDFASMGIILSGGEFNALPALEPLFRERLKRWGIDSAAPIGTLIVTRSPAELARVIDGHPDSDFLIPDRYLSAAGTSSHILVDAPPGHYFLLSRTQLRGTPPRWSCHL
jgi:hypothetical protein